MIPNPKIGLFGGTFDPIHHGHLILARAAREQLGLERVIFIPAGLSPHKLATPPAPAALRCAMLEAAIEGEAGFTWDDCEIRRAGTSFAIDTVRYMRQKFPGARFFYFIGEDNLAALQTWKEIEALRLLVEFVLLARGERSSSEGFPIIARGVDISSTDIRNRIATGASVRYLLPDAVCEMIRCQSLYKNE